MPAVKRHKTHILIPDLQVRSDIDYSHLEHIGNYIVDCQPDVIVQIGDWADLPSLSSYDVGHATAEGKRFVDDIKSVRHSVDLLERPIRKYNARRRNKYQPRKVICLGNHEQRLLRHVNEHPHLIGLMTMDMFGFEQAGWEVHPFLKIVNIDGCEYTHYVQSGGKKENAITTAAGLLRKRHNSISVGHTQKLDIAIHAATHQIGLISGCAYTHHETYAGEQGDCSKRGIWRKNEMVRGVYDPMYISLGYLKRRWS
jgi:hypothetical protein